MKIANIELPTAIVGFFMLIALTFIVSVGAYLFFGPQMDSQSLATMLGSTLGAAVAVLAVTLGNYYTAHLSQTQLEKAREVEKQGLAGALLAEIVYLSSNGAFCCLVIQTQTNGSLPASATPFHLASINLFTTQIYNESAGKFWLLRPDLSNRIVNFYSHIHAIKELVPTDLHVDHDSVEAWRPVSGHLNVIESRSLNLVTDLGSIAFPNKNYDQDHWRKIIMARKNRWMSNFYQLESAVS